MKLNVKTIMKLHMVIAVLLVSAPLFLLYISNEKNSNSLEENNAIYSDVLLQLSTIDSVLWPEIRFTVGRSTPA